MTLAQIVFTEDFQKDYDWSYQDMYKDHVRLIKDSSFSSMGIDISYRITDRWQWQLKFVVTVGLI